MKRAHTYRARADGCGVGTGRVATTGCAPRDDGSAPRDDGYAAHDNGSALLDNGLAASDDGLTARDDGSATSDDGYGVVLRGVCFGVVILQTQDCSQTNRLQSCQH